MSEHSDSRVFENSRPRLLGLAYRMLGSMADAEDVVQDTFIKWQGVDQGKVSNPEAFLTTVCTNCCLDYLKAAHRKRVDYVGPWIPEPLQTDAGTDPEADLEKAQSLTTAFLMLLERLTPKERAAYLLREVFGKPYPEVAETLQMSEAGCRQLVSRAARFVRSQSARSVPTAQQQDTFLKAFMSAIETGSTEQLAVLLTDSVQYRSDGGGKVAAITRILEGSEMVSKYIVKILGRIWTEGQGQVLKIEINGMRGLVLHNGSRIETALTLGFSEEGLIDQVFMIRNPEKLAQLECIVHFDPSSGALWH
jgi:RNA polymerase sigma factor (sigma-70 family)